MGNAQRAMIIEAIDSSEIGGGYGKHHIGEWLDMVISCGLELETLVKMASRGPSELGESLAARYTDYLATRIRPWKGFNAEIRNMMDNLDYAWKQLRS